MKKIYARQIPPEYQESPFSWCDDIYENVSFDGNDDYRSRTTDEYDTIRKYIDEADTAMTDMQNKNNNHFANATEIIEHYFSRRTKGKYSAREIGRWKKILAQYQGNSRADEAGAICGALELMTGKAHDYCCIRGSSQSEWQYIYYPAGEYSDEQIKKLEREYFNEGSEWEIQEGETEPETAEEIEGSYMYCCEWDDDEIKAEIAGAFGCSPDEVALYKFEKFRQVPVYQLA